MKKRIIAAAMLAASHVANAAIIPTLVGGAPVAEGNVFRYVYDVYLNPLSRVDTGDGFTIFDFAGFVTGSAASTLGNDALRFSSSATGPGYIFQALPAGTDDPTLPNLTWTYIGAQSLNATPPSGTAGSMRDLYLGQVSALSIYGRTATDMTSSQFHKNTTGSQGGETTDVLVPLTVPARDTTDVPEPGTFGILLFGLVAAAAARVRGRA